MTEKWDTFQTSEKIRVDYEIASLPLRLAAFIIDSLIQSAVFLVLYILIIFVFAGGAAMEEIWGGEFFKGYAIFVGILFLFGVLFVTSYHLLFEWAWKGQTPGKKVVHIRAIHDDGTFLRPSSAILRNLFRIVDFLPFGHLTGSLTMLINKKNKRVGDLVSGTIVVVEQTANLPQYAEPIRLDCFSDLQNADELFSTNEKEIIESYYQSRGSLSFIARQRIENRLTELIENKTAIARPSGISPESFIDALYGLLSK